jgi:hypothetical protein
MEKAPVDMRSLSSAAAAEAERNFVRKYKKISFTLSLYDIFVKTHCFVDVDDAPISTSENPKF